MIEHTLILAISFSAKEEWMCWINLGRVQAIPCFPLLHNLAWEPPSLVYLRASLTSFTKAKKYKADISNCFAITFTF